MKYLLDTNVVSQLSKPEPHPAAYAWIQSQEDADIFLSSATLFELRHGVEQMDRGKRRDRIEEFVAKGIPRKFAGRIIPLETHAADLAARLLFRSVHENWGMDAMDAFIAACAMVNDMTLATLNRKHFERCGVELVQF